jgi:hypothetical protein
MSVSAELSRLQTNRNTIRAKLVELGMATSTDKLDALASAIENLINRGAVNVEVKEGETYTIPAGYHNGSGVVAGVSGGGNYTLQVKTVTPTKKQQSVAPDSGYYGLSAVTVGAIPDAYQDVSSVNTAAGDVLTGKVYVTADGTVTTGTMPNNGAVNKTLDVTVITYTIPKGYHSGSGKVTITLEEKSVTPTKSAQTITPTAGKVLSKVSVAAIPDEYQDVTNVDATAADVLAGKTIVDATGEEVEGAMPNNGAKTSTLSAGGSYTIPAGYHNGSGKITAKDLASQTPGTAAAVEILSGETAWVAGAKITGSMANNGDTGGSIDGLTKTSVTIPAGYTSGGTVSLTNDIEEALAAI